MTERASQRSFSPGKMIGRYTLGRCIGYGGMGAVYEATHNDLKKKVAIKTLDPIWAHDPEVSARFLREGESAARIRHPHVVDIYDVGREGDVHFLVMELLVGEDLNALLKRKAPLSAATATEILLPVCAAVAAAHRGKVIHRDLKPANIYLTENGPGTRVPKILDFGISKHIDAPGPSLTSVGVLVGTPNYMAPEQAHGHVKIDHRVDVYSLGVVLYQCATGERPIVGKSTYQVLNSIVEGRFDPPSAINPDIDRDLERVILRAMARNRDERFQTMDAFGAALLPFASAHQRAVWSPVFDGAGADASMSISLPSEPAFASVDIAFSPEPVPLMPPEDPAPEPGARVPLEPASRSTSPPQLTPAPEPLALMPPETSRPSTSPPQLTPSPPQLTATPPSLTPAPSRLTPAPSRLTPAPSRLTPAPGEVSVAGARPPAREPSPRDGIGGDGPQRDPRAGQRRIAFAVALVAVLGLACFTVYFLWEVPADPVVAVPVAVEPKAPRADIPPPLVLPPPAKYKVAFTVFPSAAQVYIDDERVGTGEFEGEFDRDGTTHKLVVRCRDFRRHTSFFTDEAPPERIELERIERRVPPPKSIEAPAASTPVAASSPRAPTKTASASARSSVGEPTKVDPEAPPSVELPPLAEADPIAPPSKTDPPPEASDASPEDTPADMPSVSLSVNAAAESIDAPDDDDEPVVETTTTANAASRGVDQRSP